MTFDDEMEREDLDYAEAERLIQDGQLERVLQRALADFDSWDRDDGYNWYTMRIFRKLVYQYPQAVYALKQRRDRLEAIILEQRADRQVFHTWKDLNDVLEEKLRTMDVYNQLLAKKAPTETLNHLLFFLWRRLIKEQRYSEVNPYLRSMTSHLLHSISDYDSRKLFPREIFESQDEILEYQSSTLNHIAKDGPVVFEAALALGHTDVANAIMKKMIKLEPSDRVFSKLIKAAIRAKSYSVALELHTSAQLFLDAGKMKKANKALEAIPSD